MKLLVKRIFDVVISFIGLLVFFPIFIIIGISISTDSKGGVFYTQSRVGRYSKDFLLIKFRTMNLGSEKSGLITIGNNDNRITKVGYFLRKYKLDELPQLMNVFLGQMSFVGPRPEVRKYVNLYTKEQLNVLSVKPGITDFASIKFSNENEILGNVLNPDEYYVNEIMPEKLKLNMDYINNMTFFGDLKIIIQTIKCLI